MSNHHQTLILSLYLIYLKQLCIWVMRVKGQGHSGPQQDFLVYTLIAANWVGSSSNFQISLISHMPLTNLYMGHEGQRSRSLICNGIFVFTLVDANVIGFSSDFVVNLISKIPWIHNFTYGSYESKVKVFVTYNRIFFMLYSFCKYCRLFIKLKLT